MAKAKKVEPKTEPEAPPAPKAPDWERAKVEIIKSQAERLHREVTLSQYNRLVSEHGGAKVKVLEVIQ